jgi:hypothetical protein
MASDALLDHSFWDKGEPNCKQSSDTGKAKLGIVLQQ